MADAVPVRMPQSLQEAIKVVLNKKEKETKSGFIRLAIKQLIEERQESALKAASAWGGDRKSQEFCLEKQEKRITLELEA